MSPLCFTRYLAQGRLSGDDVDQEGQLCFSTGHQWGLLPAGWSRGPAQSRGSLCVRSLSLSTHLGATKARGQELPCFVEKETDSESNLAKGSWLVSLWAGSVSKSQCCFLCNHIETAQL